MKYFLIFTVTFLLIFSCKSIDINGIKMNKVFESIEFMEILKHHSQKEKITIYDSTKNNIFDIEYGFYESFNKKILSFKKINFELNVNSKTNNIGIVLYKFEKKGTENIYYFVDAENKLFIQLSVKNNKKVKLIEIGNF